MAAFWNLGRKEQVATGIHLGVDSVRMVELRRTRDEVRLGAIGYGELTEEIGPRDLLDTQVRKRIAEVIAETADAYELDTEAAVFSACQNIPVLKQMLPGTMSMEELRSQSRWEVEQALLAPSEEYDIDLFPVGRGSLMAAVRRELTDACVDLCAQAGVYLAAMDVDALALYNAGEACQLFVPGELSVLVSVEGGFVSFAAAYGRSFASGESIALCEPHPLPASQIGASLVRRIRNIARRWRSTHRKATSGAEADEVSVHLVVLNGAGAEVPELVSTVESKMGVSVEIGDPFQYQDLEGLLPEDLKRTEQGSMFTVAMGLAYRGLEEL